MMCPNCESFNDKVVDTRPRVAANRYMVKRRRECLDYGWRWNTTEKNDEIKTSCADKETLSSQFIVETEICLAIRISFNALRGSRSDGTQDELEIIEIALEGQTVSSRLLARLQETHQDELEEVCWDEVYSIVARNLEKR